VFYLFLMLLIVGLGLAAGLYAGGLFTQGYIYTEPSPQLAWGAPVAGAILFFFLSIWSLIVVLSDSSPGDIPYDALHRFSPRVDRFGAPAKELWAVRKGGKKELYVLHKFVRGRVGSLVERGEEYRSAVTDRPWNGEGVEAIEIRTDSGDMRFEREPEKNREPGAYAQFVTKDGWAMTIYESGPTGMPSRFRFGRFFANLLLNLLHLSLWFGCLWLLLRFEWSHAALGAFVLWVACTLIVLPMLLSYAAEVSQARHAPPVAVVPQ
jgi:hypothetical protein